MNTSKKIAWHTTAVAAAALFSAGSAQPAERHLFRERSGIGVRTVRDEHIRVWRDHGCAYFTQLFKLHAPRSA